MQVIKSLDTNKGTYYCGYISKYERTEAEKAEQRYMIIQKLIGLAAMVVSIGLICMGAFPAVLVTILGIAVMLTNDHVVCL